VSDRAVGARRLALGAAILVGATVPTRRPVPPPLELDCFDAVNGLPDSLYPPLYPLMQFGAFAAVPVTAAVVWLTGDHERAGRLLAAGTATWLLAKGVKRLVRRGRPAVVDARVRVRGREQSGDGFVSGHAAVAVALASGAMRALPSLDPVLAVLASTVGLSRMYVGTSRWTCSVAPGSGCWSTVRWSCCCRRPDIVSSTLTTVEIALSVGTRGHEQTRPGRRQASARGVGSCVLAS
jgi:undecaprenyl-diphosphatase